MTLTKFVSEFHALNDFTNLQHLVKNSYVISLLANCLVALILVACSFARPDAMHIHARLWPDFVSIARILAVFSLVNGLGQVPRGILLGLQQYTLANITTIPTLLSPIISIILMTFLDVSMIQYVIFLQSATLISGVLAYRESRRFLPDIRHGLALNKSELKRITSFNVYHIINQISDILFYTTDKIILQHVSGSVTVANYAVVERPNQLALSFSSLPLSAIVPACSKAHAKQNITLLDQMLITGTRFYLMMILPALCTMTFLMHRFLFTWMGEEFVNLTLYAQLFMVTMIAAAPFRVFSHIMIGKGRIREIVTIKMAYAAINVGASYYLAKRLGILGVIIPTLIFWITVYPTALLYLMKKEAMSLRHFILKIAFLFSGTVITCWVVVYCLDRNLDTSLGSLLLIGILSLMASYLILYVVIIDREEKVLIKDMLRHYMCQFARS